MAGIPRAAISLASLTNKSIDSRLTPGIDITASDCAVPSMTNTGKIRSSALSVVSWTRRRENSLARRRRIRVYG